MAPTSIAPSVRQTPLPAASLLHGRRGEDGRRGGYTASTPAARTEMESRIRDPMAATTQPLLTGPILPQPLLLPSQPLLLPSQPPGCCQTSTPAGGVQTLWVACPPMREQAGHLLTSTFVGLGTPWNPQRIPLWQTGQRGPFTPLSRVYAESCSGGRTSSEPRTRSPFPLSGPSPFGSPTCSTRLCTS